MANLNLTAIGCITAFLVGFAAQIVHRLTIKEIILGVITGIIAAIVASLVIILGTSL